MMTETGHHTQQEFLSEESGVARLIRNEAAMPAGWPDAGIARLQAGYELGRDPLVIHTLKTALGAAQAALALRDKESWQHALSVIRTADFTRLQSMASLAPGTAMRYVAISLATKDTASVLKLGNRLRKSGWRAGADPDLKGFATVAMALVCLSGDPSDLPALLDELHGERLFREPYWKAHLEGFSTLADAIYRLDQAAAGEALETSEAGLLSTLASEHKRYMSGRTSDIGASSFVSLPVLGALAVGQRAGLSLRGDIPFFDLDWINAATPQGDRSRWA